MSAGDVLFYAFALLTVGMAVIVVTTRNIVYAAFALMASLFGTAGLYVMLHADFLAATQVLVYVGGILILVLFGVMMTRGRLDVKLTIERGRVLPGAAVCLFLLALVLEIAFRFPWQIRPVTWSESTTASLGKLILGKYLLPFEVASLVLLVALIGAALITRKEVRDDEK